MLDNHSQLIRRVVLLREAFGMNQTALAEMMTVYEFNWTQTTVWRVETGKRDVSVKEAGAWASIFDLPLPLLTEPLSDDEERALLARTRLRRALDQLDGAVHFVRQSGHDTIDAAECAAASGALRDVLLRDLAAAGAVSAAWNDPADPPTSVVDDDGGSADNEFRAAWLGANGGGRNVEHSET